VKAYITKYALTRGIYSEEGHISNKGYFYTTDRLVRIFNENDYHGTMEDAIYNAMNKRNKKILSLKKQITKLKKLTFDVDGKILRED